MVVGVSTASELVVEVVGLVELVPVDLTEAVVVTPEVGVEVESFLIVGEVAGEVAVVVGTGVGGVVPVESRGRVVDGAESGSGVESGSVFGFPDPVEHGGGVKCLNNL